jgi:RNA polymerase sigma factor (TIGR02999 family)
MNEATPKPVDRGLAETSAEWFPLVYDELRRMARASVMQEGGPVSLTATALVHEAWLRMDGPGKWESRRHFFGAAAEAMRRILIDRARARLAAKRGGGAEHLPLDEAEITVDTAEEELLGVHEALETFRAVDALAAEIVSLRYFAGLPWAEIAELTDLSERELQRQWQFARTWLHAEISAGRR